MPDHDYTAKDALDLLLRKIEGASAALAKQIRSAIDAGQDVQAEETILPAAGNATPTTYEDGGRQYEVIAAGGGKRGAPISSSVDRGQRSHLIIGRRHAVMKTKSHVRSKTLRVDGLRSR